MKRKLAGLVMLIIIISLAATGFAAALEQDQNAIQESKPVIVRYAYVLDRLDSSVEEFQVCNSSDYLGIITELKSGDVVVTGDDQLNFNLLAQVEKYSQSSARKLNLKQLTFDNLTANEQAKYKELKGFYFYAVEEQVTQRQNNDQVIIQNSDLENAQYFVSMITQIKSLRNNF